MKIIFKVIPIAITMLILTASCSHKVTEQDAKDALTEIENGTAEEKQYGVLLDYMEADADPFFKDLQKFTDVLMNAMDPTKEPDDKEMQQANDFFKKYSTYLDCIMTSVSHQTSFSAEDQKRLSEYSQKHQAGLEDVGLLIGLAAMLENDYDMPEQGAAMPTEGEEPPSDDGILPAEVTDFAK